jgi:hypothetical protein
MPMTPGLGSALRLVDPPSPSDGAGETDIHIEAAPEAPDVPAIDSSGHVLRIEHGDGSVTVSLDGQPIFGTSRPGSEEDWFGNLVDRIDAGELNRISSELLRGIDADLTSRREWVEQRATGVKLMGLMVEIPSLQGAAEGAPVEGMSKVRHPLLLEAVLRFQANARSELLPTDGPVKVRNDNDGPEVLRQDSLANALERDLNHYLTSTATEYYPDTDRMLLMLGFGGTAFKKVYFCPLRNRPVSESVDASDLIVNNSATDLANAKRITHRAFLKPSTVKRLQILGVYRDIDLMTPQQPQFDALQRAERDQQGIQADGLNPEDRDREIYECYCELDILGFEHKKDGKATGLEIPYIVTIDVSSREILSITRNYEEDDQELPTARQRFVKYQFVPGLGFYDIGLLHILGNTTNAVTAAWRELLDSGMYANFPGFLMADTGARQNTNIFRVPPGGGALVKTGGMPISQAIMPLPYKDPSMALMQLVTNIAETGMRIGGTSEQQVGEGRAEAPVGTTLAMIEQATKVMNSVHKRLHAAQAEEFQLLVKVFREHPDSFWQRRCKSKMKWNEKVFLEALDSCDLVPQADPNTASHAQRVMKIMALKQLQQANPSMYDPIAVDQAALRAIGWNNPQQFMAPPEAQKRPPPELQQAMAKIENDKMDSHAKMMVAQAKVEETKAKIEAGAFNKAAGGEVGGEGSKQVDTPVDHMLAQAKLMDAEAAMKNADVKERAMESTSEHKTADRASRDKIAALGIARDVMRERSRAAQMAERLKASPPKKD